jgi:uncharacterized Zn finger protein (UPF0148 family)
MIEYKCRHCGALLETDDYLGGQTESCPMCHHVNRIPPSRSQRKEARRIQKEADRDARTRKRLSQLQAEARANKIRNEIVVAERIKEANHQAVLHGQKFDAGILVAEFHRDWLAIQKDTGLTPLQISQGVKEASPAVGLGAGYLTGDVWIGLLAGIVAYLASGPLAKEYARTKFEEWRLKWTGLFSAFNQEQLDMFAQVLAERHPLVYRSLTNEGGP